MDAVLLARLQFAVSAGFHFLFPPVTLGLTLIIFILEIFYFKNGKEIYKNLSSFLIKILGLHFVLGTATGIVLEFSFGTNWAAYSRFTGDIFGAPLAAEGVFAFFLESVFIAILLFGRERVSKKVFLLSAFLVFFASHLSGLWILIANSWMHTPAGFEVQGNRAVLTSFFEAAVNHSTAIRFIHVVVGGWITGAFMAAGIAAYYLLRKRHVEYAKILLSIVVPLMIITCLLQIVFGHSHAVQVANTQPAKMAAFEGLWETQKGAPLAIFGLPDSSAEKTHLFIGIPKLLSFLIAFDPNHEVKGLKDFPKDERPPVFIVFNSYHIMIGLGSAFVGISLLAGYLLWTKKIFTFKPFLFLLILAIPLPHVANQTGWISTEVGRQPWAVQGLLKTADAISISVPAWQILFSLIMFILIYIFLFLIYINIFFKLTDNGPKEIKSETEAATN